MANGIEEGRDTFTAGVASIEVDGDAADWADIRFLGNVKFRAENGKLVLFEEYAGGHWSGPDDLCLGIGRALPRCRGDRRFPSACQCQCLER